MKRIPITPFLILAALFTVIGVSVYMEAEAEKRKQEELQRQQEEYLAVSYTHLLLQYDYIGGSGSRGYGKIAFENIIAETVVGEVSEELLAQCNKILSQAIQE